MGALEARLDLTLGLMEPRTGGQPEAGDKVQPVLKEDCSRSFVEAEETAWSGHRTRLLQRSFRMQFWGWSS